MTFTRKPHRGFAGPGGTTLVVDTLGGFAPVVLDKIFREIADAPEPATLLLLSSGLLGLALSRRRNG